MAVVTVEAPDGPENLRFLTRKKEEYVR